MATGHRIATLNLQFMETEQLCVENLILESRLSVFHA